MDRETIHILLVEDSETHAALIRDALESGHIPIKLTLAQNLAEAHACLSETFPHLAIIDLFLPDGNGVELLPAPKEEPAYPIVIMSSQGDEQAAVEAMKAGAVDYVVKSSATLAEMPRIVERALREWRHITERKQAQEALQESEERFRSFFDSAASGMVIIDLEGRALRINPTFCRLSGYSETEALAINIFEVTHPDDREKTRHLYNELRMGRRRVVDYEKRYLCKDGSVIWGHATVAGVFGSDGALRYFAANVQDITEHKRVRDQIRESKQMLQLVLDYIPQYVFWKDHNSVYLGCNRNFAQAAGVERPQDLVGKTDYDLAWKKEEADFYRKCDRRVMETDTPELRIIEPQLQASGKQAWLDTNKIPLHNGEGRVVGILGTFEDITERKRAEKDLQESEERFRATFEQAAVGIAHVAPDGHWIRVNQKLCDIVGYPREELLKGAFQDITHPDDLDQDMECVRQVLAGEIPSYSMEKRYIHKSGSPVWCNLTVSLVREHGGDPKHFISVVEDITDRKQAEENLKEANRELDAFAYTVSHDLRSPLTPIIGYADFLRESCSDRLDEQALGCLAEISTAGGKMLALMENLLTLAKVGQMERPVEPFDTSEVVNEVVRALSSQFSRAEVAVKVNDLPSLRLPKTFLIQIFDNLIGNAVRYAGREGHPIEVGGERKGDLVRLYVCDHGPGIPAEERNRIFEVFYRGTTGKKSPGTGVGLATVQKIARLYNGRVWVEETAGGGSTFLVEMVDVETTAEDGEDTV